MQFGNGESKKRPIESEKELIEKEKKHCFMEFHKWLTTPFPIQDVLDGKWNDLVLKELKNQALSCKFYSTKDEARKSLIGKTQSQNHKAAYIVELGVDVEEAKRFIRAGKFNLIIVRAINNYDLQMKITFNSDDTVGEIKNENYNPGYFDDNAGLPHAIARKIEDSWKAVSTVFKGCFEPRELPKAPQKSSALKPSR